MPERQRATLIVRCGSAGLLCLGALLTQAQAQSFDKIYNAALANVEGRSITQTSDGGYIVAGGQAGSALRGLVAKLDADGAISWQKLVGVDGQPTEAYLARQTTGGYVVVAIQVLPGGTYVLQLLSLDPSGKLLWQASYPTGGLFGALPMSIEQTADGGFLLAALDFDGNTGGGSPLWVLKLDAQGHIAWQKRLRFTSGAIRATLDGGYIAAGTRPCTPDCLAWVVRLDGDGNVGWQRQYAVGTISSYANSALQTPDGGYLVTGGYYTTPTTSQALLMKLDAAGNAVWQQGYAPPKLLGASSLGAYQAEPTVSGGYLVSVVDGASSPHIVKVNANAAIEWQETPVLANTGGAGVTIGGYSPTQDGGYVAIGTVGRIPLPTRLMALKADPAGALKDCAGVVMQPTRFKAVPAPAVQVLAANIAIDATAIVPVSLATTLAPGNLMTSNPCQP